MACGHTIHGVRYEAKLNDDESGLIVHVVRDTLPTSGEHEFPSLHDYVVNQFHGLTRFRHGVPDAGEDYALFVFPWQEGLGGWVGRLTRDLQRQKRLRTLQFQAG